MVKEFRDFLLRGNLVELAVAFVLGLAFVTLVGSFIASFVTPFISMIIGEPDFSSLTITINDAIFSYGSFITASITFVATAAAVFFFIVKPLDALRSHSASTEDDVLADEERRHQELIAALEGLRR